MTTFVLIHGAWHGGWCWHKVVARLESRGHSVFAPDLPGHGRDPMPIASVTLGDLVRRVHQVIDTQSEPVVLLGHSYGGAIITQASEARSAKVRSLVYLTAFLPDHGQTLMNLAGQDGESHLAGNVIASPDGDVLTVKEDCLRDCFYGQCGDDDIALARTRLGPEATAGMRTAMQTSAQGFGRLPRYYVECLKDNTITPAMQKKLYTAMPCERVFSLDTDHSPFFSAPDTLVEILTQIA